MKKYIRNLWIIAMAALFLLPYPLSGILYDYVDHENYEKRELASMPETGTVSITEYPSAIDAYVNDHLPFRNEIIWLNNRITIGMFKKSPSDQVIIGKDGWYFYNNEEDGNPIADYQGNNLYTEEQLSDIKEHWMKQKDLLEAQGKTFVIMIIPNKDEVYDDKMPDRYGEAAEMTRAQQLYDYMKDDIDTIYVKEDLKQARLDYPEETFYRYSDTHWNNLGAYIGARALLKELGIEMPELSSIYYDAYNRGGGDLANMMNLTRYITEDVDYYLEVDTDLSPENTEWEDEGAIRYHTEGADHPSLMVVRDSFGLALAPLVAHEFEDSLFIHHNAYTPEMLNEEDPEIVVLEVVERRLSILESYDLVQE